MFQKSQNFQNINFVNKAKTEEKSAASFLRVVYQYMTAKNPAPQPEKQLPFITLNADTFNEAPTDGYRVTWLGHSTTLIELDGLKIMTDPVFSDRASPFTWMGPKRFQKSPIDIADVPELDAVILSHDHYDHLDKESIEILDARIKAYFTPLGVGEHLVSWGVDQDKITELDWWEEATVSKDVKVAAVPAQHFSGRGILDGNSTLWASWAILGKNERLFFSGDTGFHDEFAEIGERYGPFDLALIENGAYNKSWPDVHMMPEETVRASKLLKAKQFMPIHWGTFNLALHPWYEPAQRSYEISKQQGVDIVQPRLGEFVNSNQAKPLAQWWNDQLEQTEEQLPTIEAVLVTG